MWCDGSDPAFQRERLKAMRTKESASNDAELTGIIRFESHDELKYSMRSIHAYLPWVHRIFIVTNKQRPHWLKVHPKVTIVDHSEIIPAELLPTFNSVTIGSYITRINGLSEHFLLFNDDVFINRLLSEGDFFKKGKPIVWINHHRTKLDTRRRNELIEREKDLWMKTLLRAWSTFSEKNETNVPFFMPAHSVVAYTKSIFDSCINKYPELNKVNSSTFRTGEEISRHLFSYEMIYFHKCPFVKIIKKTSPS